MTTLLHSLLSVWYHVNADVADMQMMAEGGVSIYACAYKAPGAAHTHKLLREETSANHSLELSSRDPDECEKVVMVNMLAPTKLLQRLTYTITGVKRDINQPQS